MHSLHSSQYDECMQRNVLVPTNLDFPSVYDDKLEMTHAARTSRLECLTLPFAVKSRREEQGSFKIHNRQTAEQKSITILRLHSRSQEIALEKTEKN